MGENNERNNVRPQNKNLLPPMKKGETRNPNGRPLGQRNYATIYRAALENIAKANNKSPEEIETLMEEVGLKNALKGNHAFWKDVRDRIHGLPKGSGTSVNVNITAEPSERIKELARKLNAK